MLRYILKRQLRTISGADTVSFYTIDGDTAAVERALASGGYGEDHHDLTDLVGIEVIQPHAVESASESDDLPF